MRGLRSSWAMRRVAIVGSSGAGKSWLAGRLASVLGVAHVELDGSYHGPGWVALPADEMRHELDVRCPADEAWVADGNYETKGGSIVRAHADTVVWLDFPSCRDASIGVTHSAAVAVASAFVERQSRVATRRLSIDPERSVVLWSWTRHEPQRRRYVAQRDSRWVCLTTRTEIREYLRMVEAAASRVDSRRPGGLVP